MRKSSRPRRPAGVRVHESRRWRDEDVVRGGPPRTRPATATVQAGLWASSDREASLLVLASVQQRLCSVDQLAEALQLVRRAPRLRLLRALVAEAAGGVASTGELDLARLCRERGLPEPDRQTPRRLPSGRAYLDAEWPRYGLVVEVDGVQHLQTQAVWADALRDNEVRLSGAVVLRVPASALRLDPGPFLDQVERALVAGGWRRAA